MTAPDGVRQTRGTTLVHRLSSGGQILVELARFLSMRPDAAQVEGWDELISFPSRWAPMPWQAVQATVSGALGRPIAQLFDVFETIPVRSEPFVQVHSGQVDGENVVIKIVRPEASRLLASRWQRTLRSILIDAGLDRKGDRDQLDYAVDEAAAWMHRRFDLRREIDTLQALRGANPASRWNYVPEPYAELSTDQILVTERVTGTRVADLQGPARRLTSSSRAAPLPSPDTRLPGSAAMTLLSVVLGEVTRNGWCQGDLRPDNIIAVTDETVSFADYSEYLELPPSTRRQQLGYLTSVFSEDLLGMSPPLDRDIAVSDADLTGFRRALMRLADTSQPVPSDRYALEAPPPEPGPGSASSSGPELAGPARFLLAVLRLSRQFQIPLAPGAAVTFDSVIASVRIAQMFERPEEVVAAGRAYLRDARLRSVTSSLRSEQMESTVTSLASLLRDSPGQVHRLLSDLAEGTFTLRVTAGDSPATNRNANRRTQLVVASIVSVGLAALLTARSLLKIAGISIGWPIAVVLVLLYIWIVLQWRSLR